MDIITKNIRLNISINYIEKCNLKVRDFFKSDIIRNIIISSILDNNISYKTYIINNVFYMNNTFFIDITIEVYLTKIIKFLSINDALNFCLYFDSEHINNTYDLYKLKDDFYLIIKPKINIQNDDYFFNASTIKSSDFNIIKYTPLIYSTITQNGFKVST